MDLATENKIATLLLKEAAELRRQAEREGALAYLHKPTVRGRPNSRFLTATVLGVQQANRAVEVNEMWRLRQKELENENRNKRRLDSESRSIRSHKDVTDSRTKAKRCTDYGSISSASCSSTKRDSEDYHSSEEGLRDDEVEEFLQSRAKRGRGTIGSRMDETGPYPSLNGEEKHSTGAYIGLREEFKSCAISGPEKPLWLNSSESSEDDASVSDDDKKKLSKRAKPDRCHSRKHKSKSKSREKDKRRRDSKRHKSCHK